jgi:hypothetical protein
MLKALSDNKISQPVTYPVRASLTANSEAVIERLLEQTKNSTLTLWGPETDIVDVPALKQVVDKVGRNRIYMDIPEKLKDQLTNAGSTMGTGSLIFSTILALVSTLVQRF